MPNEDVQGLVGRAVDATREGVIITDAAAQDNPIIYVNRTFVRITGYPADEIIGRNCRFLQRDDREQPAIQSIRSAITAGLPVTARIRNYRKNGALFWNDVSISPIRNRRGSVTHFVGVLADVTTQQRDAEHRQLLEQRMQQRQHLEALGTLAGGIAHDINNTLVPITTLSQILLTHCPTNAVQREALEQIGAAGERILQAPTRCRRAQLSWPSRFQ